MRTSVVRHEIPVGAFMVGALLLVGVGVFWRARSAGLIGAQRMTFVVAEGLGVQPGAPVLLRGIVVGEVDGIELTPDARVQIGIRIAHAHARHVKKDAIAALVAPPILGATRVEISPGESSEQAEYGQELATRAAPSFMSQVGEIEKKVDHVIARVDSFVLSAVSTLDTFRRMVDEVSHSEGLAGQMLHDRAMADEARATLSSVRRITEGVEKDGVPLLADLRSETGPYQALLRDIDAAVVELRKAVAQAEVAKTSETLRATAASLQTTAERMSESAARLGRQVDPVSQQMTEALAALRAASDAMARLGRELERQPNAVIFGREASGAPGPRR